jgi:hypothetical protein
METSLSTMFTEVADSKGIRNVNALPSHMQYFFLNVGMLEAMSEKQYEEEHPDWGKLIREDYAKVLADREAAKQAVEAAKLAESEGVKFIAKLTKEQQDKLMAFLEAKPAEAVAPVAEAVAPVAEAVAAPVA